MKRQKLTIRVIDTRKSPPAEKVKTYTNHADFLRDMGRIGAMRGVHISEETIATVHLYSERTTPGLFE